MNQIGQTFLIFAVGLAGGLVGSMLLSSPNGAADSNQSSGAAGVIDTDAELSRTLDSIQSDLAMLFDEVAQQEAMTAMLDSRLARVQALRHEGATGAAGANLDPFATLDPGEIPSGLGFDAAVNAAIEKREADEAAVREATRTERREEALERQMERWIEDLGLDTNQADQMKTILNDTAVARNEFFTEMRESGVMDRELIREKMTEIGDSRNKQLGDVLTTTQMEQYTEMTSNSGGGGRRGGGGF